MRTSVSERITNNARLVIAVMVLVSAVVAAGIPMVEGSTSLDQFQTDADEADAQDYVDANFSAGETNTSLAQVIVRDEDVLDGETLVSMLEYERTLRNNETVNATLAENDSVTSVANLIATTSIRQNRTEDLRSRQAELNETNRALYEAATALGRNPNASINSTFEAVDANSSVNLTEDDYTVFENTVQQHRASTNASTNASRRNATTGNGTVGSRILAEEYTAVSENRTESGRSRRAELNETKRSLDEAALTLGRNPNASINTTFEGIDSNTSVNLSERDYTLFAESVQQRRSAYTAPNNSSRNRTQRGNQSVGQRILADEYSDVSEDRHALRTLDPTLSSRLAELRRLNESEVDAIAASTLAGNTSRSANALAFLPDYYEPGDTETNATLLVVSQETPGGSFAPGDAPAEIEDSQAAMTALAPGGSMSVLIYGDGIVSTEITDSMVDSVLLVGPLALAFVLIVLVVVYRDLLDILLGLLGIGLVLVWTFGLMGWVDIAFSQPFIVVLVLLIGLSIDYGLHIVMRYREARGSRDTSPGPAMAVALGRVGLALVYVTTTTALGFLSNLTSPLTVFRELGIVSAIGIVAALLVFGILVPALKIELDELLESRGINRVKPAVGTGSGPINSFLATGGTLATNAPYVVIVLALLVSSAGVYGATDIDASFEQSDFLAEDPSDPVKDLPEPFGPGTYTAETAIDTLDSDFVRRDTTATILARGDVTDPATVDRFDAARDNASGMSATETYSNDEAAITDPITVMDRVAAENESFNATLSNADTDDDGVPDRNVTAVFDELYRVAPDEAGNVLYRDAGDYEAARMVVTVSGTVEDETVRDQMDWVADDIDGDGVAAIATGDVIVNQITADQLAQTALTSLVVALLSVLLVISIAYRITEGSASLGVVTIIPVAFTLTWVLGTMALLDIPFNIVTGMITGLTIGLGVDYSLHISERFNQERQDMETVDEALHETLTGTGGALLSSAATTASGFAVLLVAVLPFLQSFGLITALTIVFAFIASVFVLPSLLVVWAGLVGHSEETGLDTVVGTEAPESPLPTDAAVFRMIERPYVLPEEPIPVTVSLADIEGRVALRETVPGEIREIDVDPDPVAVEQRDGTMSVLWDLDALTGGSTVSYTVKPPESPDDGDELTFEGVLEDEVGTQSIEGEDTATVVADVFQRVLERGEVTTTDINTAIEREDVTAAQVDRLCRAWLRTE